MDIQDKGISKIKLRKTINLLLIQITIAIIALLAKYLIDSMGFEFRTLAIKIIWSMAAVWGIAFVWLIVRICRIVYYFPEKSKWIKVVSAMVVVIIVITTVLTYMIGFMFFAYTVKDEQTISYKNTTYIAESVSYVEVPSGVVYHKVVNPFLYEKQRTTDIIAIETYTGVIRSWNWSGGDNGSVRRIQVDIGSIEMIEFTLIDDDVFKISDPIPVDVKVQIECEHHPDSEYRPILSISLQ